jgi:hypothetical protein
MWWIILAILFLILLLVAAWWFWSAGCGNRECGNVQLATSFSGGCWWGVGLIVFFFILILIGVFAWRHQYHGHEMLVAE